MHRIKYKLAESRSLIKNGLSSLLKTQNEFHSTSSSTTIGKNLVDIPAVVLHPSSVGKTIANPKWLKRDFTTIGATIQKLRNDLDHQKEIAKGCHELETKVQELSDELKEHKSCPDKIKDLSEKLKEHDSCAGHLADLNKQLLDHASCASKIQELESARDGLQIELAEAVDDVQYWEKRHKDDVVSAAFIGAQDFAYKFLPQFNLEIPSAYKRLTPEQLAAQEEASTKGKEVPVEEEDEEEEEERDFDSEEESSEEEAGDKSPKGKNLSVVKFAKAKDVQIGESSTGMTFVKASQLVGGQNKEVVTIDDDQLGDEQNSERETPVEPNVVGTVRDDCHPEDDRTGDIGVEILGDLLQDRPPSPERP